MMMSVDQTGQDDMILQVKYLVSVLRELGLGTDLLDETIPTKNCRVF